MTAKELKFLLKPNIEQVQMSDSQLSNMESNLLDLIKDLNKIKDKKYKEELLKAQHIQKQRQVRFEEAQKSNQNATSGKQERVKIAIADDESLVILLMFSLMVTVMLPLLVITNPTIIFINPFLGVSIFLLTLCPLILYATRNLTIS